MRFPSRWPSKSATFWVLMAVAALSAFVLPWRAVRWTGWPLQSLTPMEMLVSSAARDADRRLSATREPPLAAEKARELRGEIEALQRALAQQQLKIEDLERQLAEVTGLRAQVPGSEVRIVLGLVVGYDADPRRETLAVYLLSAEARQLVRPGLKVLAGTRPLGEREPQVALRGWLIGQVIEMQTNVARVQLTTDPGFRDAVQAARVLADGTWQLAESPCVIRGQGRGTMRIEQVPVNYFESGQRIVVWPGATDLPLRLSLGQMVSAKRLDDAPQYYDLTVVPWQSVKELTHVYILAPGR